MYKGGTVYIMSSPDKTALYIGVTSDLPKRIWEHQNKQYPGSFTSRYNCTMLVWYQHFDSIEEAIAEEKRLKAGSRFNKEQLVNNLNPGWKDLSASVDW